MGEAQNKTKLTGKDLITIGIYTVIYIVIVAAFGALGVIPIFIPLTAVFCPLLGGIPYMLFVSKTKKFGMVTIMGTLIGLIMFVMGMGYFVAIVGFLACLGADLILRQTNFESSKGAILSCGVFSLWDFGNLLPFYIGREAYMAMLEASYGSEYVTTLSSYLPMWTMPALLAVCFIFGILGGILGMQICKKHFKRAGIA